MLRRSRGYACRTLTAGSRSSSTRMTAPLKKSSFKWQLITGCSTITSKLWIPSLRSYTTTAARREERVVLRSKCLSVQRKSKVYSCVIVTLLLSSYQSTNRESRLLLVTPVSNRVNSHTIPTLAGISMQLLFGQMVRQNQCFLRDYRPHLLLDVEAQSHL